MKHYCIDVHIGSRDSPTFMFTYYIVVYNLGLYAINRTGVFCTVNTPLQGTRFRMLVNYVNQNCLKNFHICIYIIKIFYP